jgi:DNA adenine methylase
VNLRPFLKWIGGKRQLLTVLRRFYPRSHGRYFEPFVGGGAVFFDLFARGHVNGGGAVLSDANADLIGCYRRVSRSLDDVLAELDRLAVEHAAGGRECYLKVRDERFNPMRAAWRQRGAELDDYSAEMAAMLIYLNRTGFNGLFRQNAAGQFNVPPGRYDAPRVVNRPLLTRAANALGATGVRLEHGAFDRVAEEARAGDFVYFDPPYVPLSMTANFDRYTGRGFSRADQHRLQRLLITLARRGVQVLLSNSVAPMASSLYEGNQEVSDAGLRTYRFPARRSVNSRPDRRGLVEELVVSNIPPRPAAALATAAAADVLR